MVEHGLGEGLSTGGLTKVGVESERLGDGEVSPHGVHGGSYSLLRVEDVSSSNVQTRVDTSLSRLGNLNLDQEHGLLETGGRQELRGEHDSSGGGHDLTGTSVDRVRVQGDVHNVESDTSQVLLGTGTLLGGPLETGDTRVLDLVQVLDGLGGVDQQVGTGTLGTETPNLPGLGNVPTEFVGHETSSDLEVVTGSDLAGLDGLGELLVERGGGHVDSVVLVLRLGQGDHGGLGLDGLLVSDDGVGLLQGDTSVVVLQVLQRREHECARGKSANRVHHRKTHAAHSR